MRIAVVGGGPGGSRAAELLVRRGARVVLYESRAGWEKPCGGGLPGRGIDACPLLRDPSLPHQLAIRARIYSTSNREAVVPLVEPLRVYSRRDLDAFLLNCAGRAGVDVRAVRVNGLARAGNGWEVRDAAGGSEQFDFLVGADGASGFVRGRVDQDRWPRGQVFGIGYYVDGYTSAEIVLKFFTDLDGYLWIFPRTDHLAVGICGPTGDGQGEFLLKELERFLVDLYGGSVLARLRRYGARIPSLPPGVPIHRVCQGRGWALIGDAAGFVDPLTREGIHYALASAETLSEALVEGNPLLYGERWEQAHGCEMDWACRHAQLFFSRRFIEVFRLLASASPAVQTVISDLIAARQPYCTLRRRLTGLAAFALGSLTFGSLQETLLGRTAPPPPTLTPLAGRSD